MTTQTPREWWIHITANKNYSIAETEPPDYVPGDKNFGCAVHVIEHSAYLAVYNDNEKMIVHCLELAKERDALAAQLAETNRKVSGLQFFHTSQGPRDVDAIEGDIQGYRATIERLERAIDYAKNAVDPKFAEEHIKEIERLVRE